MVLPVVAAGEVVAAGGAVAVVPPQVVTLAVAVAVLLQAAANRLAPNRPHDRGVHPICDLVRWVDSDRVEARFA
jgi:hypothetical protein